MRKRKFTPLPVAGGDSAVSSDSAAGEEESVSSGDVDSEEASGPVGDDGGAG